jgi:MFS family permease
LNSRRNIVTYFIAFLTGDGASQVQAVAVAWSVYSIHHRAFDLGLVGIVMFAPSLLLVFVAGHVVDRYDRKRIVLFAAIAEAGCSLVLAGLAFAHVRDLLAFLGVLFAIGIARAFGSPAEQTILVNLVEAGAYMRVQSRYSSLREIVVIAGPAFGGALVAFSETTAFVAAAVMTLISVAAFVLVGVPAMTRTDADAELDAGSALDGLRFIVAQPIILGAISLDLFAVLFGGAVALLPMYADQILHVGPFGFGLLRGAGGLGACAMAIVLSQRPPQSNVGRTLLIAVAGFGIATFVFAYSRELWLSIAALAAAGALDMISVVIRTALVQLNTPDAMRGRVNAVEGVFVGASGQVGAFESGTLAQFVGPVTSVAIGGVAVLVIVVGWALWFPALRRSDRFHLSP